MKSLASMSIVRGLFHVRAARRIGPALGAAIDEGG